MSTFSRLGPLLLGASILVCAGSGEAHAQIVKHIKQKVAEHTAKKVAQHQAQAESTVVKGTDKVTDSALTKSNRGVDATMNRATAALDTTMNRSERAVSALFGRDDGGVDQLSAQLAAGRAVLRELVFGLGTADFIPSSDSTLKHLASVLRSLTGPYLIEGHVDASMDTAMDQRLSEARALAVKMKLVTLGVPESRLFTIGLGSTRPVGMGAPSSARIEVARVQ